MTPRPATPGPATPRAALRRVATRKVKAVALITACLLFTVGCSATIEGHALRQTAAPASTATAGTPPGAPAASSPSPSTGSGAQQAAPGWQLPTVSPANDIADSEVGLKSGAAAPDLAVQGGVTTDADAIAVSALADLATFYGEILPRDFGVAYAPPRTIVSYDSTDPAESVCGESVHDFVNAFYMHSCDAVAWDRGVLMPLLTDDVGVLAPAVVLTHELGHQVQYLLGESDRTPTLVMEQQADCYAGAFWRWVSDDNSAYFNFNQNEGMRQLLLSLFKVKDPVSVIDSTDPYANVADPDAHGNGFDRTYAATLGFTSGAVRCSRITAQEIAQRGQQFPFLGDPYQFGNVDITEETIGDLVATVNQYFSEVMPGYVPPRLTTFDGETSPACDGYESSFPVAYCPVSHTVSYSLPELRRIGTPTAGWDSSNGDFSAIMLLVTRYALAAQSVGHSKITGNNAGLRALCYTGTWATWMREPRGEGQYQLSPNDLDKGIYEIVSAPLAGADANGHTTALTIERVQAFDIGVTHLIPDCFDFYAN